MNSAPIKFAIEYGSLIIFFLTYKISHNIKIATGIMIATAVSLTIVGYFLKQRPSIVSYSSTLLLAIMGTLTIVTGDSRFIKMKPTVIYTFFGTTLLTGAYYNKGLAKFVFDGAVKLSEDNWIKLSNRLGLYFITLATINEIVWRNFSEEFWVNFKLMGILPITAAFMLTQVPFVMKNRILPPE